MPFNSMRSGWICMLAAAVFLSAGCGGSSVDTGDSNTMTQSQAEAFAESLSLAGAGALGNPSTRILEGDAPSGVRFPLDVQPPSVAMIYQSLDWRTSCANGGSIHVTGDISGSIDDETGTGMILIGARETISDCSLQDSLIFNGDPYISLSGQFSYVGWEPSTQQHMAIDGGVKWGGTAAESCQIHLDTNFDLNQGGGRTTGTVCDYTIDISF